MGWACDNVWVFERLGQIAKVKRARIYCVIGGKPGECGAGWDKID